MYYQRPRFGFGLPLTPAVKNILFANGIVFLMQWLNPGINSFLSYNFGLQGYDVIHNFKIWQLVTYMFLHGGFWHIFMNMFIFWMFGTELEMEWGSREFVKFYFICGIGGGLLNILLTPTVPNYPPTVGASGAIYGILLAYALNWPNREVIIFPFPIPIKVKYLVGFMVMIQFFATWNPSGDGIAHAAHLGGVAAGFIYLKYWNKFDLHRLKDLFESKGPHKKNFSSGSTYDQEKVEFYRHKIDELLDKINRVGYLKLTDEEKELLEEGSKYLREHDKADYN